MFDGCGTTTGTNAVDQKCVIRVYRLLLDVTELCSCSSVRRVSGLVRRTGPYASRPPGAGVAVRMPGTGRDGRSVIEDVLRGVGNVVAVVPALASVALARPLVFTSSLPLSFAVFPWPCPRRSRAAYVIRCFVGAFRWVDG